MSRYWEGTVYEQPSEDKIRKNAADTLQKEKKKGKSLSPVIIPGRAIAKEWWGKAWCENLERYADYESRLDRGKRYVRTEAVIDLQIQKGKVSAKVQGRRKTPYKVEIKISPFSEARCQKIIALCGNKIQNLEVLMEGNFPEELKEAFCSREDCFRSQRRSVSAAAALTGPLCVSMWRRFYMGSAHGLTRIRCFFLNFAGLTWEG